MGIEITAPHFACVVIFVCNKITRPIKPIIKTVVCLLQGEQGNDMVASR